MKLLPDIVFMESARPDRVTVIYRFPGTMRILDTLDLDRFDIDMPFAVGLKQLQIAQEISTTVTAALLDDIAAYEFLLSQPRKVKQAYLDQKKKTPGMAVRKVLMMIRK